MTSFKLSTHIATMMAKTARAAKLRTLNSNLAFRICGSTSRRFQYSHRNCAGFLFKPLISSTSSQSSSLLFLFQTALII